MSPVYVFIAGLIFQKDAIKKYTTGKKDMRFVVDKNGK